MASDVANAVSYSFQHKRILVTGGGRGLGLDIVKRLHADGAVVFVIDCVQSLLDDLKAEFPEVTTICKDVKNWDDVKETVRNLAPLDHLINNAGVLAMNDLLNVTQDDFNHMVEVNVRALIPISQAFVQGILENGPLPNGSGTIVNMSSMSDRVGFWGGGVYATTKAAVTRLTMAMAQEWAQYGIRVNCLNPSFISTHMVMSIPEEFLKRAAPLVQRTPIESPILPSDVTNAVLFLLSPLSDKITGSSLQLDGGLRTA